MWKLPTQLQCPYGHKTNETTGSKLHDLPPAHTHRHRKHFDPDCNDSKYYLLKPARLLQACSQNLPSIESVQLACKTTNTQPESTLRTYICQPNKLDPCQRCGPYMFTSYKYSTNIEHHTRAMVTAPTHNMLQLLTTSIRSHSKFQQIQPTHSNDNLFGSSQQHIIYCDQHERLIHNYICISTSKSPSNRLNPCCLGLTFLVRSQARSWPHRHPAFHVQECELGRHIVLHSHKQRTILHQNPSHDDLIHSRHNGHAMEWIACAGGNRAALRNLPVRLVGVE